MVHVNVNLLTIPIAPDEGLTDTFPQSSGIGNDSTLQNSAEGLNERSRLSSAIVPAQTTAVPEDICLLPKPTTLLFDDTQDLFQPLGFIDFELAIDGVSNDC